MATRLSASACSRRLRRLEDRRVIRGYTAIIDPKAEGRGLTAFVAVRLARHQREHIQRFQAGARKVPEIIECHHVTGTFDYLLRVEVQTSPPTNASTPTSSPRSTTSRNSSPTSR